MKALLINPENQSLEVIEIASLDDIKSAIGFDTLESDAVGDQGDRLYFDEECFLRGSSGRFQIDSLVPVSGKGIVIGSPDEGASLSDAAINLDDLSTRIKYL